MKHPLQISFVPFLLVSLLLSSGALAQTADAPRTEIEKDLTSSDAIFAARSAYTRNTEGTSLDAGNGVSIAQLSPPRLMRPSPSHDGGYRRNYPMTRMDHGGPGFSLIGAAIGFGIGAAIGAKANTPGHPGARVGVAVVLGSLGAAIGGMAGGAHGGPFAFAHHRRIPQPPGARDKESDLSADSASAHLSTKGD
jgi:hypothetical protein